MVERLLADCRSGLPSEAEFVFLVLKEIRVDRARGDAAFVGQTLQCAAHPSARWAGPTARAGRRVGQLPVSRLTLPASLNFSAMLVAAAGCTNLPKRVPVLAKPQEGNSILNASSACQKSLPCLVPQCPPSACNRLIVSPQITPVNQPGRAKHEAGCPTSRSFLARCGIPPMLRAKCTGPIESQREGAVVSHISRKTSEMPEFPVRGLDMAACAPFFKERRMKLANPLSLTGNWGVGPPGLREGARGLLYREREG